MCCCLFPDALDDDIEPEIPDDKDKNKEDLNDKEKHQLKHRELFLSRQVETLPATHIRGKCAVTLLNETEALLSYLNKEASSVWQDLYLPYMCSGIQKYVDYLNIKTFASAFEICSETTCTIIVQSFFYADIL